MHRLSPRALTRSTIRHSPWLRAPPYHGNLAGAGVSWGHEGGAAKKQAKDYWRKNMATFRDAKFPDLKHVALKLDLFPERSRYHSSGKFDLTGAVTARSMRFFSPPRALGKAVLDHG